MHKPYLRGSALFQRVPALIRTWSLQADTSMRRSLRKKYSGGRAHQSSASPTKMSSISSAVSSQPSFSSRTGRSLPSLSTACKDRHGVQTWCYTVAAADLYIAYTSGACQLRVRFLPNNCVSAVQEAVAQDCCRLQLTSCVPDKVQQLYSSVPALQTQAALQRSSLSWPRHEIWVSVAARARSSVQTRKQAWDWTHPLHLRLRT